MIFKKVLVAVDDSPQAEAGLDLAIELAGALGSSLTIVHAIDPSVVATAAADAAAATIELEELQAAGKELLEKAIARAKAGGVDAESMLRDGIPASTILDTARRAKSDLIVIGTHGRRGVARIFLGSCAEAVLRDSPVPVLVKRS